MVRVPKRLKHAGILLRLLLLVALIPGATTVVALKTQALAATYQTRRRIAETEFIVHALHASSRDHSLDAIIAYKLSASTANWTLSRASCGK
jgi:hypothetical protein